MAKTKTTKTDPQVAKTAALKAKRLAAEKAKPAKAAPAPKPAVTAKKPTVSAEEANAILARLRERRSPLAQAKEYRDALRETGWRPVELARRLGATKAEISDYWNAVIWSVNALDLDDDMQRAIDDGSLSLPKSGEIWRVKPEHRRQLFEAATAGAGRSKLRRMAIEGGMVK